MERVENQYTESKAPSVIDTACTRIANTQGDAVRAADDDLQNLPIQTPFSQDNDHVSHPPEPCSSRIRKGCLHGSNSPPHNILSNDHLLDHSSSTWNNLPLVIPMAAPQFQNATHISDALVGNQTNLSNTNNRDSFNTQNTVNDNRSQTHHHLYLVQGDLVIPLASELHSMEPVQEVPPRTKVDMPTHPSIQIPTSDTRKSIEVPGPSSSKSTMYNKDVCNEEDRCASTRTSRVHARAEVYPVSPTSALELGGETLAIVEPKSNLVGLENSGRFKRGVQATRILTDSTNKFKRSMKSIRTSIRSGVDRSITSLATQSKPTVPAALKVKNISVVPFPDMEKKIPRKVKTFMHADLDPIPGLPPFHPLRDPNMTHRRSSIGSLDPFFGVNVYDIGYFDGAGQFTLLFNLLSTKEENEELLKFKFRRSSFLPLTGVTAGLRAREINSGEKYKSFQDDNIVLDKSFSRYNPKSNMDEYQYSFKVRKGIEKGTAIALMGDLLCFADLEVVRTHKKYFAEQGIEWYRHAKGDRQYDLRNGDLVFITACYKVPSWGYVNYYGETRPTEDTRADFQQGLGGRGLYGWKYSLEGLESAHRQSRRGDPTAGTPDQCIGVRTYSIHCDPKAWKTMCKELESEVLPAV